MNLIEFNEPTIRRKDMGAALMTMAEGKIGPGEKSALLNEGLCKLFGLKEGLVLRSLPDAIEAAFSICGLKTGDKVALSALAPGIYAEVAKKMGLSVEIIDIDAQSCCIDMNKAMEKGASALVLDEPLGTLPLASAFPEDRIPVIEDASQSVGSVFGEAKAGSFGDVVVCALEEDNLISAAGGAFCGARGQEFVSKLKEYKSSGAGVLALKKLPDMNSALAIAQLANLENRLERRKAIYKLFQRSLQATSHKLFGLKSSDFESNGAFFAVLLNSKPSEVVKFGQRYRVPIKMAFQEAAGKELADDFDKIPKAIPYMLRTVLFPIYPFLLKSEIEEIAKVIGHLP